MRYLEAIEFVSSQSHEDEWDYDEWEYPEYQNSMEELQYSQDELWEELVPHEVPAKRKIQPRTIAWAVIALLYVLWWGIVIWIM